MTEKISWEKSVENAWLAAAIDGEGCILLSKNKARTSYDPRITITNTDPRFIAKVSEILYKNDVKFFYSLNLRLEDDVTRRDRIQLTSSGLGTVQKYLLIIEPYLTCKKEQAQLLLSYIAWRQELGFHKGMFPLEEVREKATETREELTRMKFQRFNLQRIQRTASKPLILE